MRKRTPFNYARASSAAFISAALAVALIAAAAIVSCSSAPRPALEDPRAMPYKRAEAYCADPTAARASPLASRIAKVPSVLLDYLRKADGEPGYAAYLPSEEELGLFSRYVGLLPPKLEAAMESGLVGIYFIEGFKGGGLSDYLYFPDGSIAYILVLNPQTIELGFQDWVAYRDASPYETEGSPYSIRTSCPGAEGYKGLLHTLAHEAAHLYDYQHGATPYVERSLAAAGSSAQSAKDRPFSSGVWESYAKPIAAYSIPELSRLAPYGLGPSLPLATAAAQYEALGSTPFASLYGAASWAEDFAEAAAWSWLRERLGITYEVDIEKGGAVVASFRRGTLEGPSARRAATEEALK